MTDIDPGIRFPGESEEYRRERNRLLQAEAGLRRAIEQVAAQRRALPPGGVVPDDYRFDEVSDRGEVRFSELFETGKDTLVIYNFMFPRYSGDTRPGPPEGETAKLPLAETPCASCTSILDSLDGAAPHLSRVLNLAVVAKSDPDRIRNFARERGWRHLRLLSSRDNAYNRDYHAETPEGEQMPILNVFARDGDQFRHTWASELMYAPRDEGMEARHVDSVWPIWNVLDATPAGRTDQSNFPSLGLRLTITHDHSGCDVADPTRAAAPPFVNPTQLPLQDRRLQALVVKPYRIPSGSMLPTLAHRPADPGQPDGHPPRDRGRGRVPPTARRRPRRRASAPTPERGSVPDGAALAQPCDRPLASAVEHRPSSSASSACPVMSCASSTGT